jgi:hypothetical protein
MKKDQRRITLVARDKQQANLGWDTSNQSPNRIVSVDSLELLRSTIASPLVHSDADVERIILDRCGSEADYLSLLSQIPHQFTGDVLMIRNDATGFLSATGRGGDRVLYALSPDDVEFYLETVRLVQPTEAMEHHVLKFRPRIVQTAQDRAEAKHDRQQNGNGDARSNAG